MAKTIKYTGTQDRWAELPVTGSQAIWRIGQQESRSDSEAALLLASGLFSTVADAVIAGAANSFSNTGVKRPLNFLPVDDASAWNDVVGCSVAVDTSVLFNGTPTLCISLNPGVTTARVGCLAASGLIPNGWDLKNVGVAVMGNNVSFLGWDLKIGDATFTNFYSTFANTSHYGGTDGTGGTADTLYVKPMEWWVAKAPAAGGAISVGGGSPAVANLMRPRLTFSGPAASAGDKIWIGFCGVMPARKKPTIIVSLDDGFKSHATFVRDLCLYHDIPVSLAVNASSLSTGNYMSVAQCKGLYDHPSNLFDIVNHGSVHTAYNATTFAGSAAYANAVAGRDGLRAIGIKGDGPLHFATPNSLWGNDLLALLKSGGFLTCRNAGYSNEMSKDQFLSTFQDKWQFNLNTCSGLRGPGAAQKTLAQVLADVDTVIADGGVGFINGHDLQDTASDYVWLKSDYNGLMAGLAARRDAGQIEIKSWSRWFADTIGAPCDRR